LSSLPRVAEATRERVSRELDHLGPDVCIADIKDNLRRNNPELLDMATKWAADVGDRDELMLGFCVFYRLLLAQAATGAERAWQPGSRMLLDPLPRVAPKTRALLASQIDEKGIAPFVRDSIEHLERNNPQLLQVAHRFAARHDNYLGAIKGFAVLYACLVAQSAADRSHPH
jgi:hypothetical protein